jgi:hypothetical protein
MKRRFSTIAALALLAVSAAGISNVAHAGTPELLSTGSTTRGASGLVLGHMSVTDEAANLSAAGGISRQPILWAGEVHVSPIRKL